VRLRYPADMRRFLGATGRVLITVGVLMLLFVAYQLWGTSLYEARAQNDLKDQFQEQLRRHPRPASTAPTAVREQDPTVSTTTPPSDVPRLAPVPAEGDAVGLIEIPKIGVSAAVVEGVDVGDLRKGPGHYPSTPFPGQEGNSAIAGHRTTYGAPFSDLDRLQRGDDITLQTVQGTFRYRVERDPFAVNPNESSVLLSQPDPARPGHNLATLTLTTCNPKYSAAERLIVSASLVLQPGATPLPASPGTRADAKAISGLSGDRSSRLPALLFGMVAAAVGALWWLLFHRHPRWTTWLVGVIPFLIALFVFYTYLERMLPSNY
jgi:sortase A